MSATGSTSNNNLPLVPLYDRIPLSHLIETAVQKSYHELFTMAELLQSKPTLERKKELIKFVCTARQLFIRVLAVVRWAASAKTVNQCDNIQDFLECRARLIRDTSDFLAQLAREKLVAARLPNFPVADSIDALTLGRVNFLPKRIEEAMTTLTPVSEKERQDILPRLQEIVMSKVTASDLLRQYNDVVIKNGILTLLVKDEFQVTLSVTNDDLSSPWHIIKIDLFAYDAEEPEQVLIHPLQIQALTRFVQSWLLESAKPLIDIYHYLHYFYQTLRLQILFEQAHRLRNQIYNQKDLKISGYIACKRFNIEYWKEYSTTVPIKQKKKQNFQEKTTDIGMTVICEDDGKFSIIHYPPLPIDDSVEILQLLQKSNVTMEQILNRTIYARSQRRFEQLKQIIQSHIDCIIEIDSSVPALKCTLLPDSAPSEILFINISSQSGLFHAVCYMETHCVQKIEQALNGDIGTLQNSINSLKIWLIHQRVRPMVACRNCRVHYRIPSVNMKHPLLVPFADRSIYIELTNNPEFYIIIHVSNVQQLFLQYYLLIVERRSSTHESPLVVQTTTNTNSSSDEGLKWTLEPLLLYPLDTAAFLRRELINLEKSLESSELVQTMNDNDNSGQSIDDDQEKPTRRAPMVPISSLKSIVKLVNYYDEMLTLIQLKEEFQKRKTSCKSLIYNPWTGIPSFDLVSSTSDEFLSCKEFLAYVNEEFWPRIHKCTVRINNLAEDPISRKREWIFQLIPKANNFFQNFLIKTPYNSLLNCNQLSIKIFSKTAEYIQNRLRTAFELTQLVEDFAESLTESPDLYAISELSSFTFFSCTIRYGLNLDFAVILTYNSKYQRQQDSIPTLNQLLDLRFFTSNRIFLSTAHQIINKKLISFLSQTHSLKQFVRLLHMTAIPLATIVRMCGFNKTISLLTSADLFQPTVAIVPYTERRWRLIFSQTFVLDIQISGPNLILIRDGSYDVHLEKSLPDLSTIPGLKGFLAPYADDQGLSFEFFEISSPLRTEDFLPFVSPAVFNENSDQMPIPVSNANGNYITENDSLSSFFASSTASGVVPEECSQRYSDDRLDSEKRGTSGSFSQAESNADSDRFVTIDPYDILLGPSQEDQTVQNSSEDFFTEAQEPIDETLMRSRPPPSNIKYSSAVQGYHHHLSSKSEYPVYLTQQKFFQIFYTTQPFQLSRFESFLTPSILVNRFARFIYTPEMNNRTIRPIPNETQTYRLDHLNLQLAFLYDNRLLNYRIRLISPAESNSITMPTNYLWSTDELRNMENFFADHLFPISRMSHVNNMFVSSIEQLSTRRLQTLTIAITSFAKMLSIIQTRTLRDLAKIIELSQNPESHHLWRPHWCLTIPNDALNIQPNSIQSDKSSVLFLFEFHSRTSDNDEKLFVPLVHNSSNNQTTLWDQSNPSFPEGHETEYNMIKEILNSSRETISKHPCSLLPSISDLIIRLKVSTS